MKIPKWIYQDNFSFLNCSIWLKNGRLVKKTVLDSQKGEKRLYDHNFFKIGHSELFIGLFCWLLTQWRYKIVIWQIPDAIRKSVWVDMELPSALSDPHSHCFQWFPRLGGPRGKHPWQGLSSQTGLALTSRLRAGIGQLLPGWRTKNNWQLYKARLYEIKCHMATIPFPVYSMNSNQLFSAKH